jgi:hypothetical protein
MMSTITIAPMTTPTTIPVVFPLLEEGDDD